MSTLRQHIRLTKFQADELAYLTSLVDEDGNEVDPWIVISADANNTYVSIDPADVVRFQKYLQYRIDGALDNYSYTADRSLLGYANSFRNLLTKFKEVN